MGTAFYLVRKITDGAKTMTEREKNISHLPGSDGEHTLQIELGNEKRALAFYNNQMLDYLNHEMQEFIKKQYIMFIASSDAHGECDCTFRSGEPGFVRVIDHKRIMWPEYRGNGVTASGGNVKENPHLGLVLMDFVESTMGLHINGKAWLSADGSFENLPQDAQDYITSENAIKGGKKPVFWFLLEVEEAYAHCAKHTPRFKRIEKFLDWGTDDTVKKGGDFFKVKTEKRNNI